MWCSCLWSCISLLSDIFFGFFFVLTPLNLSHHAIYLIYPEYHLIYPVVSAVPYSWKVLYDNTLNYLWIFSWVQKQFNVHNPLFFFPPFEFPCWNCFLSSMLLMSTGNLPSSLTPYCPIFLFYFPVWIIKCYCHG